MCHESETKTRFYEKVLKEITHYRNKGPVIRNVQSSK